MAINIPARVHQTTATTGIGTYTMSFAPSEARNYRDFYEDGSVVPYCVSLSNGGFEIGAGTLIYGASDTISRDKVLASSNSGAPVNWGTGVKDIFVWRINGSELTPQEFGAVGDGVADDSTALNAWFAALLATELPGRLISWYKSSSQIVWDFTSKRTVGFKITGNGPNRCGLLFADGITGPNFQILSGSGDGFYPVIRDFSVHGNTNNILTQLGNPTNIAINEMVYEAIEHKNFSSGSSSVALAIASLYNCQLFVVANCGGKTSRAAILMNTPDTGAIGFNKIAGSFGNAGTGMEIASGFVFGNTLIAPDFEECHYCMGGASAFIGTNDISGGTFVFDTAAFNFSGWNGYQFWNGSGVNIAPSVGGAPTFAPGSKITVVIHGKDYSTTPAVPASGVSVRNETPNMIVVTVWHGIDNPMTNIHISNPDLPSEDINIDTDAGSFTLTPGEQVALTYSASPPSWLWRPIL